MAYNFQNIQDEHLSYINDQKQKNTFGSFPTTVIKPFDDSYAYTGFAEGTIDFIGGSESDTEIAGPYDGPWNIKKDNSWTSLKSKNKIAWIIDGTVHVSNNTVSTAGYASLVPPIPVEKLDFVATVSGVTGWKIKNGIEAYKIYVDSDEQISSQGYVNHSSRINPSFRKGSLGTMGYIFGNPEKYPQKWLNGNVKLQGRAITFNQKTGDRIWPIDFTDIHQDYPDYDNLKWFKLPKPKRSNNGEYSENSTYDMRLRIFEDGIEQEGVTLEFSLSTCNSAGNKYHWHIRGGDSDGFFVINKEGITNNTVFHLEYIGYGEESFDLITGNTKNIYRDIKENYIAGWCAGSSEGRDRLLASELLVDDFPEYGATRGQGCGNLRNINSKANIPGTSNINSQELTFNATTNEYYTPTYNTHTTSPIVKYFTGITTLQYGHQGRLGVYYIAEEVRQTDDDSNSTADFGDNQSLHTPYYHDIIDDNNSKKIRRVSYISRTNYILPRKDINYTSY